jgi:hypothetical protein
MTTRVPAALIAALLIAQSTARAADPVPNETLRSAVQKSLAPLVRTSPTFIKKGGCNSCHNQMLPAAAQAFARGRGIEVGPPIEQLAPELSEATAERYAEYSVAGGAGINALAFEFFANDLLKRPADARIRSQIHYIKSQQQPNGHWRASVTNHGQQGLARPGAARPPLITDDFTPTAFMVRAMAVYGPSSEAADTRGRIDKARDWLAKAQAVRTQEHAFRVLGLKWAGADRRAIESAARSLQTLQHANGGFSQLPTLPPDAYATGIALYALHEAGMPATHQVYQSGLKFLLSTQAPDGTWHVRSRSLEFQPYFESGYPYERDQWISAAGAAYATFALAAGVH